MTAKFSTGLRDKMLDTNPLKTIFNLGFIKIYSGAPPADADAAVTGTLLCTISNNDTGTGLTLGTAASGVISKNGAETWSGTVTSGTAGYFRHVAAGDTGVLSTTEARIQGVVALAGGEINLASITLVNPAVQAIDAYSIALPTL